MKPTPTQCELQRARAKQDALVLARTHLRDPGSKLGRLLAAYGELSKANETRWVLPER